MTPGFKPFTVSSQYKYGKRMWKKTTFLEVIIAQLVFSLFFFQRVACSKPNSLKRSTNCHLFVLQDFMIEVLRMNEIKFTSSSVWEKRENPREYWNSGKAE